MTLPMSQEAFHRLREFIFAKCGLEFPEAKKYLLESRLSPRLNATHCRTFEEYYDFLRFDPNRESELRELFNRVTTNETFFFRDTAQIDCFRQVILPQVMKDQQATREIRIWSAGCSSGEEPFTLAIVVAEEFPALATWDVQVLATDLSEQALEDGRRGVYGPYALRHVPPAYLKKYFTGSDGQYAVGPVLRKMVKFSHLNLVDSVRMRAIRDMDMVFCRNVLIYFDQETRKKIITHFYDALRDRGMFVIGFSESLNGINRLFRPAPWNKTIFYYKVGNSVAARSVPSVMRGLKGMDRQPIDQAAPHSGEPRSFTSAVASQVGPVGGSALSGRSWESRGES